VLRNVARTALSFQEFEAWLKDIKKITDFNGPKWQQMELFKEYCEEYNTCSLPSEKCGRLTSNCGASRT
jgi:hypothetical protein